MPIETVRNRDIFIKIWFMFYLTNVLRALGIYDEVKDLLPTERITFENIGKPRIFNHFLDFRILTKSERLLSLNSRKTS